MPSHRRVAATPRHPHVDVVLYEVAHHQVVAELGEVHGRVLVLGQDVAVGPVLQQEAHHVGVPPLTRLGHNTSDWLSWRLELQLLYFNTFSCTFNLNLT